MSSTPRFFVTPNSVREGHILLPADAAHHAVAVLRLRPGESLIVHDNTGRVYRCRLAEGATRTEAVAEIESSDMALTEPETRITVAQALPKTSEKIEEVLQHGTEAGASGFAVWGAARSVAKLESGGDKREKRLARWRGIVQGASEQSGRGILPGVEWHGTSAELIRTFGEYEAVLILHEGATVRLRETLESRLPADSRRFLLIAGPEGGLTDTEVARFEENGGISVSLGPRILRTETAALVAIAQVLYQRGE